MSRRDSESNSNRHHSRFDPEPSPKRYIKDVKQKRDRTKSSSNVGHRPDDHHEPPKRQADRSSGQMKARERGWWKDIKNQHSEKEEISQGRNQREEKSQAKPNDSTSQRRDGISERKETQPPTSRKRPAFRENKIPMDLGDVNLAATVAVKSSQFEEDAPERKERRKREAIHSTWTAHTTYKDKASRDGFPSRERQRGNGGNGNSRGRENFNGRQVYGYLSIKTQTEKWKPDLYQDVNKDPVLQNEDDQIAKLKPFCLHKIFITSKRFCKASL